MTTSGQELTLFGGWAKMRTLQVTDSGASKGLAVTSVSISRLKLKPRIPPIVTRHSRPFLSGCAQREWIAPTSIQISDEDRSVTIEIPTTIVSWDGTYQWLWKSLWNKLERFYYKEITTIQPELWQEDEEIDEEIDQEEPTKVLVDVSPLERSTDQIHMLWIARLELRKRIKLFHRHHRNSIERFTTDAEEYLHLIGDDYLTKDHWR